MVGFTFTTVYDRVEGRGRAGETDSGRVAAVDAAPDSPVGSSGGPTEPLDADPPSIGPDDSTADEADSLDAADESRAGISKIRLLPPTPKPGGGLLSGKVAFDTLTIDPEVAVVEFYLDGQRVSRRAWPPFETKLTLADPPREQVVRAVALAANDRVLGED